MSNTTALRSILCIYAGLISTISIDAAPDDPVRTAPVTIDRARQALDLSKLAANNGMQNLSLRAVRESLSGGPPIQPIAIGANPGFISPQTGSNTQHQQFIDDVQKRVRALSVIWSEKNFEAAKVFDALRPAVLPDGRADEVFLYVHSIAPSSRNQQAKISPIHSVADILIEWAVRADRVPELNEILIARAEKPRSRFPAAVLRVKVAIATRDYAAAATHLNELHTELKTNSMELYNQTGAQLAMSAVGPAETREIAGNLLETCAMNLSRSAGQSSSKIESLAGLLLSAGSSRVRHGNTDAAARIYKQLLTTTEAYFVRSSAEYAQQRRQQFLTVISQEYVRSGKLLAGIRFLEDNGGDLSAIESDNSSGAFLPSLAGQLGQMKKEDRYDLLYRICMPTEKREEIRTSGGFIRARNLPKDFQQIPGGSTADSDFGSVATGSGTRLFSTGLALLEAARETGKFDQLMQEVAARQKKQDKAADELQLLAEIKDLDSKVLLAELERRAKTLEDNIPKWNDRSEKLPMDTALLAAYCLDRPELLEVGERTLRVLVTHSQRRQVAEVRNNLWNLLGQFVVRRHDGPRKDLLESLKYQHWISSSFHSAQRFANGPPSAVWIGHENMMYLLSSTEWGKLHFRYPLTGDFEFSCFVNQGAWREGALGYDGVDWDSSRYGKFHQGTAVGRQGRITNKAVVFRGTSDDHPMTIRAKGDEIEVTVNGHVVMKDRRGSSSPWLALRGSYGWTPSFRDVRITGNPTIPREVRLLEDDRLRGWVTSFYAETATDVFAKPKTADAESTQYNWNLNDGVLSAAQREGGPGSDTVESRIYYERPMQDGDEIQYEFFYERGSSIVHPSIGRLAFILHEDRIGLHWLTNGLHETTSLSADNEVNDPQGNLTDSIPLKPRDWNLMSVSLQDGTARLRLNGTEIFERTLTKDHDHHFGFFRHANRTRVQIRNVVLTGDWPESLDDAIRHDIFAAADERSQAEQLALGSLIGEEFLSRRVLEVVRHGRKLKPDERYRYLSDWVLPGKTHPNLRVHGKFVPSYDPLTEGNPTQVVAPVLDLVDTAQTLGRLDELRKAADSVSEANDEIKRAKLCLQALVNLADGKFEDAGTRIDELSAHLPSIEKTPLLPRWVHITASARAILHPESRAAGLRTLDDLVEKRINGAKSGGWKFDHAVRNLRGLGELLSSRPNALGRFGAGPESGNWIPVTHAKAETLTVGIGPAHWEPIPSGYIKFAGHEDDFLYYRIPLLGDFQVEADVSAFDWRETRIMYGSKWVGPTYRRNDVEVRTLTHKDKDQKLETPLVAIDGEIHLRMVVKDGMCTVFANNQRIRHEKLSANHDPWLAFASHAQHQSRMRNVRISGSPTIPRSLSLSPRVHGTWIASWYGDSTADKKLWTETDRAIVGNKRANAAEATESLLQYHRPLIENCELTYQFRYRPGSAEVHPALGRTVFLISPEGVKLHRLTDGIHDDSGLGPDASRPAPGFESAKIAFEPGGVHNVTLRIQGDKLSIDFDGTKLGEHTISPNNNRLFGFFHYSDRTQMRVSDVVLTGGWPKALPALADQQLAGNTDTFAPALKPDAAVTLALGAEETQPRIARQGIEPEKNIKRVEGGISMGLTAAVEKWQHSGLVIRHGAKGDFDVSVAFDDLNLTKPESGSTLVGLTARTTGPYKPILRIHRAIERDGKHYFGAVAAADGVERRSYRTQKVPTNCTSGRLRLVRRGADVYFLAAEGDSDKWILVLHRVVGAEDVPLNGFSLQAACINAKGETASTIWRNVRLAAGELTRPGGNKKPAAAAGSE